MDLRRVARQRESVHQDHKSSRPLSDDYEFIGISGEAKFAEEWGLPLDIEIRPGGDGGQDFRLDGIGKVDVKTAQRPGNLIVEVGKVHSDAYVLAGYSKETDETKLIGWEFKDKILKAPTRDFGYGIINHYISRHELRPMSELKQVSPGVKIYGNSEGFLHRQYQPITEHSICDCKPPQNIWREDSRCLWSNCGEKTCSRCLKCLSNTIYKWEWTDKPAEKATSPLGYACGCGGTARKERKPEKQALFET